MENTLENEMLDAAISWCDSNGINVLEPEQLSSLVNSLYVTVRDAAQPVPDVNAGYGELEAIMSAEFESHGFGAPESNKREYGRFRVGFASGWHSALTAAKQAQPVCGYDDETGNCTRVNCCKQAQPERVTTAMVEGLQNAADKLEVIQARGIERDKCIAAFEQAQPERAPLSDAELEQEFCNITGLETGINPAATDTKRALVWFKKGYAHGIKQGGQQ